jgi:hypothetical protein
VLPLEQGVDPGAEGKLDGFAGGAGGGNDNHPATVVSRSAEFRRVERKMVVAL